MAFASDLQPRQGSSSMQLQWTLPEASSFELGYDSDGDLIRPVEPREVRYSVRCERECSELKSVGDQLWNGALFLGCFLAANPSLVDGKTVLELACGVGALGGLYEALGVKRAILTDYSSSALSLCEANNVGNPVVEVSKLDFEDSGTYSEGLGERVDVILATDVWYDFGINEALSDALLALLSRFKGAKALLCCEERLNIIHPAVPPCDVFAQDFVDKYASGDNARFRIRELPSPGDVSKYLQLTGEAPGSLLRHCK
ncbi:hypothetical protein FOZ62_010192, partial [Perkinsus olseni]